MILERERKFLVLVPHLPPAIEEIGLTRKSKVIQAGYFTDYPLPAVRVTVTTHGHTGRFPEYNFCVKGRGAEVRPEFEFGIESEQAKMLLEQSPTFLIKERYDLDGWEIDKITLKVGGDLTNFWLAEWEEEEGKPPIPDPLPLWIGEEVTHNPEYSNQRLAWKYGLR